MCVFDLMKMANYIPTPKLPPTDLDKMSPNIILAQFKNGNLRSRKSKLKYTVYKNSLKCHERILVANSGRLCYVGSNFETNVSKITSSVLKVCVLNRKNSTVKLYNADFFQLKPQIKRQAIIDVKNEKTYREKSSDLTCAFGSKTQIKKMNANKKYNSTSGNPDSTNDLLATMSEIKIEQSFASTSKESSASDVIPPQNSSAVNVDEVYDLYDIISKEEFGMLDSEAQVFLSVNHDVITEWKNENKYPEFIIEFLQNNLLSMNIYKAKLLCYLNFMFHFLKTTYADWKKKNPVPVVPEPFKQKLMEVFTINKTLPLRLKDKLLAYAMVLGLKLNNYFINCNTFASSVKISMKKMTSVAYALGCHVSESKKEGIKTIQLKLPLYKFQALPQRKRNN